MIDQLNVIAKIIPHAQHRDVARTAILSIVERTRAEPGCVEFRLSESWDGTAFYLYEEWADERALQTHHQQPYTQQVFAAYQDWLAEPPEINHLRPVR